MKNKLKMKDLELGQIFMGNAVGEYVCPEYVEAMIAYIFEEIDRIYWNNYQTEWDRHDDPKLKGIEFRPYCWGEDEKEKSQCNFAFKGVELRWYKNFGRGMTLNKDMTSDEWIEWFDECLKHIRKQDKADIFEGEKK